MLILGRVAERRRQSVRPSVRPRRRERSLAQSIRTFIDLHMIQIDAQPLRLHVDRGTNIFVDRFGWNRDGFAKQIEPAVAADEADEMVASCLGFGQRDPRGLRGRWKPQGDARRRQGRPGRFPAELAVPVVSGCYAAARTPGSPL